MRLIKNATLVCFFLLVVSSIYAASPTSHCTTLWIDNQTGKDLSLSGHVSQDLPAGKITAIEDKQCAQTDYEPIGYISYLNENGERIKTSDTLFFNLFMNDEYTNFSSVSADAFARSWEIKNNLPTPVHYYGPHSWVDTTLFGVTDPDNDGYYREFEKIACPVSQKCASNPHASTGALQGDHFSTLFRYEWRMVYSRDDDSKTQFFWDPNDPKDIFGEALPTEAKNGDFVVKITSLPKNVTTFDRIYIFGDSLSDRSNLYNVTAGNMPRGIYYNGRFTNYLNWVDQFQLHTGVPIANYAFGGSSISETSSINSSKEIFGFSVADSQGLPVLPSLVDEFNVAKPRILKDISQGKRIGIIVFMGNNDYSHHFGTGSEIAKKMIDDVTTFKHDIIDLIGKPREEVTFFLASLGDLGLASIYNRKPDSTGFSVDFSKTIDDLDYDKLDEETPGFKTWPMPIDVNIVTLEQSLDEFKYDPDDYIHPRDHHMSGSLFHNEFNGVNLFGYLNLDQYPGNGSIHSRFSILPLDLTQENTAICLELLHPVSKLQVILGGNLIYLFYILDYLNIPEDTSDIFLKDIGDNEGFLHSFDAQAFTRLLDYAQRSHYYRPDFASNFDNGPNKGGADN
jgi:hypothetical protein